MTVSHKPMLELLSFRSSPDPVRLPYYSCTVQAGFPSPADDHLDNALDLNELLIKCPSATFIARATGSSLKGIGVFEGDYLIVDRSKQAVNGSLIIAVLDGECLVKILCKDRDRIWLQSANPHYPDIFVSEDTSFQIWGVVTSVIHKREQWLCMA